MIRHQLIAAAVVAAVMGMAPTGCNAGGRAEQDVRQSQGTGIADLETVMESGSLKRSPCAGLTPNTQSHRTLWPGRRDISRGRTECEDCPAGGRGRGVGGPGKAQFGMSFRR